MSLFKEFKSFAMRGNVVDMAVGIIIGAAFGKIISSLVSDILMPPIGMLIAGMDFSNLGLPIKEAAGDHAAVVIKYGMFINIVIDFTIVAFAMLVIFIQGMNRLVKKPDASTGHSDDKRMSRVPYGHPHQCKTLWSLHGSPKIISTSIIVQECYEKPASNVMLVCWKRRVRTRSQAHLSTGIGRHIMEALDDH